MKNMILLSATLAAAVLGTEAARGADGAVEVRWNAGNGDMSVPSQAFTLHDLKTRTGKYRTVTGCVLNIKKCT